MEQEGGEGRKGGEWGGQVRTEGKRQTGELGSESKWAWPRMRPRNGYLLGRLSIPWRKHLLKNIYS